MLFTELVECFERVKATGSTLEKIEIMKELFQKLEEGDLRCSNFLIGLPFPEREGRELGIGYSLLWDAIKQLSGASEEELFYAYHQTGDLGSAAELILSRSKRQRLMESPLKIKEVEEAFRKISEIKGKGSQRAKQAIIIGLLNRASAREAKFLMKIITGETRYGVKEGLVLQAIAKAFGAPFELIRKAHMKCSDLGEVAVAAKRGEVEKIKIEVGKPLKPMLASSSFEAGEAIERYGEVLVEFKYDGARVQVHKGKEVKIFTRSFKEISDSLPEIKEEIAQQEHEFISDGELVPEEKRAFQFLMRRLRREKEIEGYLKLIPLKLYVFDILYLNGKELVEFPLKERKGFLKELGESEHVALAPYFLVKSREEIEELFDKAIKEGYEGLMLKNPSSPYLPGKRGIDWLKLKHEGETLDLVVIAVEYGHGKRADMLSDYTFAARSGERLVPVAKAYCGLTDDEIKEMGSYFKKIAIKQVGRKLIVEPKVVVEVRFGEIQRSPRYECGFALRFPRIERIRWDKDVKEIDTIEKIKELYEKRFKGISDVNL